MKKFYITLIFVLSGCSIFNETKLNNLSELSNDKLCKYMGEYKDNGSLILKLHDEIMKMENNINFERCYALEQANKSKGIIITPTAEEKSQEYVYDHEKNKYIIKDNGPKAGIKIKW